MTCDEFLTGYMTRSELTPFVIEGDTAIWAGPYAETVRIQAIPCDCGERNCQGWGAKIHNEPGLSAAEVGELAFLYSTVCKEYFHADMRDKFTQARVADGTWKLIKYHDPAERTQ